MRKLYFGINEIEGDIFIAISTSSIILNDDYSNEELDKIEQLEDHEIYECMDGIYQAPPNEYSCDEIKDILLQEGYIYSNDLDDCIMEI